MTVKVTIDSKVPEFLAMVEEGRKKALGAGGATLQREMKRTLAGPSPSAAGSAPGVDRGQLRQGIAYVVGDRSVKVGTPLMYGRHLEYGFTSRPKKGKALPVPANRAARRMLQTLAGASLKTKNLVVVKRPGKAPLLVEKTPTGKVKKNGAVFVLQTSVRVLPRPWVVRSYMTAKSEIGRRMNTTMSEHIRSNVSKFVRVGGIRR